MIMYMMMIDTPEDRSKFEIIYHKYGALMFYIANKILHNQEDAEDAVQQAFIKIAENIDKISEPVCPKTHSYIVTIIESKAIDLYRHNQRKKTVEFMDATAGLSFPEPETSSLAECIKQLPPRYREVILLKYYQGMSTKEIAAQLDISTENASKLDQRAKKKLMELCKKEGVL